MQCFADAGMLEHYARCHLHFVARTRNLKHGDYSYLLSLGSPSHFRLCFAFFDHQCKEANQIHHVHYVIRAVEQSKHSLIGHFFVFFYQYERKERVFFVN